MCESTMNVQYLPNCTSLHCGVYFSLPLSICVIIEATTVSIVKMSTNSTSTIYYESTIYSAIVVLIV